MMYNNVVLTIRSGYPECEGRAGPTYFRHSHHALSLGLVELDTWLSEPNRHICEWREVWYQRTFNMMYILVIIIIMTYSLRKENNYYLNFSFISNSYLKNRYSLSSSIIVTTS